MKKVPLLAAALLLLGIGAGRAQMTNLHNFEYGSNSYGSLIRSGNVLYGMTQWGGEWGDGNIYSINADGSNYVDLFDFADTGSVAFKCNGDGGSQSLIMIGNTLYGMTEYGGHNNEGTVFSVRTDGSHYRDLLDFDDTGSVSGNWGGEEPQGSLVAIGGRLFGMTYEGGLNGYGNIFRIDTSYTIDSAREGYKDLWDFDGGGDSNGHHPYGSLTVSVSGKVLYGATHTGGPNHAGNIFSIDTNGSHYKDLHDFYWGAGSGSEPWGTLTLNGNKIFGMTENGGYDWDGSIFSIDTNGNNFTPLYDFNNSDNSGEYPYGGLTIAGNMMYGMAVSGGYNGDGMIFAVDTLGNNFTNLFSFDFYNYGENPLGNVLLYNGGLYGVTNSGGTLDGGTIFELDACSSSTTTITTSSTPDDGTGDGSAMANVTSNAPTPLTYMWTPSGGTTTTATGLAAGTYTITVTSANGCSTMDSVTVGSTLGIASLTANSGINVYPNPNNGNFTVALSGTTDKSTVEVYNTLGQQVFTHNLTLGSNILNMNSQPDGVYMYRILSDNGNLVGQGKLVIQK